MRAVLLLLLVVGCAQLQPRTAQDVDFELSGRLAARYGNEAFSGNLAWRHGRDFDEMLLSSALGAGIARIAREGNQVVLTTAEPKEYRAADAETLTEEVLGFRVPLGGLADWVRGRPSNKDSAKAELDNEGRLRTLQERGWSIEYQEYDGKLPRRLRLTYPNIELRLAISQWK